MTSSKPSLFGLIVLQNRRRFYYTRIIILMLAGGFILLFQQHTIYSPVVGILLLAWGVTAIPFYLVSKYPEKYSAYAFIQTLFDLVYLLAIAHYSGGPNSIALPLYFFWVIILSWMQPKDNFPHFIRLSIALYLLLASLYYLQWLPVPPSPAITEKDKFLHNSILWIGTFLAGTWFARIWLYQYFALWQASYQQNAFLQHLSQIATLDFTQQDSDSFYRLLAQKICEALQCQTAWLIRFDETGRPFALSNDENTASPPIEEVIQDLPKLRFPHRAQERDGQTWLLARMQTTSEPVYLAVLYKKTPCDADCMKRFEEIGNIAGVVLDRREQYHELSIRAANMHRLSQEIISISYDKEKDDLLSTIAQTTQNLLNAHKAAIYLTEKENMRCVFSKDLSPKYIHWLEKHHTFLPDWKIESQSSHVVIADVTSDQRTSQQRDYLRQANIQAYAIFYLVNGPKKLGALALYWEHPHHFDKQEIEIASLFAQRAATVLDKATEYQSLVTQAYTDALTGIPNRHHLDERLSYEIERAKRYNHTLSFMMLDLDGFKNINDQFGHPIGDEVLKQVAAKLNNILRASDFLARYGGDEFSIILPQTNKRSTRKVAQKICVTIRNYVPALPNNVYYHPLSVSIGIATYPKDGRTPQDLLAAADRRLYYVKKNRLGEIMDKDPPPNEML